MLEDLNTLTQLLPQLQILLPLQINRHNKVTISRKCSIFVLIYNIIYGNLLVNKKFNSQCNQNVYILHIVIFINFQRDRFLVKKANK